MISRIRSVGYKLCRFATVVLVTCASVCGCSTGKGSLPVPAPIEVDDEIEPLLLSETTTSLARRAVFQIPNSRQTPMTVELVKKSCSCERIELPENRVTPGQFATVGMVVIPRATPEKKAYWATLRLGWKDREEVVKVRTELEVLSDLLVEPSQLAHEFVAEATCEQQILLRQRLRSEVEPDNVTPKLVDLPEEDEIVALEHVGTSQMQAAGRGPRVEKLETTVAAPEFPQGEIWEGQWRATVRLKSTDRVRDGFDGHCTLFAGPAAPTVQIPIRLRRIEPVQIAPAYTYFGRVRPAEERCRTVLVRALDDQAFELTDVGCDSPAFTARVAGSGSKKLHTIQVMLCSSESGQYTGTISVTATHPKCPTVSFGVEGTVQGDTAGGAVAAR